MNLQETIVKIRENMGVEYELPGKPDKSLFNDEWLSKLNTNGEYVTLYHFGPDDLKFLDPEKFNPVGFSASSNWWGKPRVFFYTNLKDKERLIGGQLYEAKIKLKDLYPFNKDPLNLYDIASKIYGNDQIPVRRQVILMSSLMEKMGYRGMVYRWSGDSLLATIWDRIYEIEKID